jgi:hypothetical protein
MITFLPPLLWSLVLIIDVHAAATVPELSVEELKLMTEAELVSEALRACAISADNLTSAREYRKLSIPEAQKAASERMDERARKQQYIERIMRVWRDRYRGAVPAWFGQLSEAASSDRSSNCEAAANTGGWRRTGRSWRDWAQDK